MVAAARLQIARICWHRSHFEIFAGRLGVSSFSGVVLGLMRLDRHPRAKIQTFAAGLVFICLPGWDLERHASCGAGHSMALQGICHRKRTSQRTIFQPLFLRGDLLIQPNENRQKSGVSVNQDSGGLDRILKSREMRHIRRSWRHAARVSRHSLFMGRICEPGGHNHLTAPARNLNLLSCCHDIPLPVRAEWAPAARLLFCSVPDCFRLV